MQVTLSLTHTLDVAALSDVQFNDLLTAVLAEAKRRGGNTVPASKPVQPVVPAKPVVVAPVKPGKHILTDQDRVKAAKVRKANAEIKRALSGKQPKTGDTFTAPIAGFKVRKPDGSLCNKSFASQAECAAWLASWVNKSQASKYSVVAA